ncbi:hypothetical protein M404DRAFT_32485 [Pisolithus tinctorius Marx 270]|uniref:Uncharacterized protein n=1 Tax=Pisolithus tinctorius Marx 270 TaxID=870435 RepID=A0A0C3JI52_PISTI|nr:hypothetical protein M404DRAFT_32485 [Pisolithus tinctorius Marx 270]
MTGDEGFEEDVDTLGEDDDEAIPEHEDRAAVGKHPGNVTTSPRSHTKVSHSSSIGKSKSAYRADIFILGFHPGSQQLPARLYKLIDPTHDDSPADLVLHWLLHPYFHLLCGTGAVSVLALYHKDWGQHFRRPE